MSVTGWELNALRFPTLSPTDATISPKVRALLDARYHAQGSPEWLELRLTEVLITGTNARPIEGFRVYSATCATALLEKCGMSEPFMGTKHTAHGSLYEDVAREKYTLKTGRQVLELGLVRHRDYSVIGASVDGLCLDGKRAIEIKCPWSREIIEDVVPDQYWQQLQLNCEILDVDEIDFVQYRPAKMGVDKNGVEVELEPEILTIKTVARDPVWFGRALPKFLRFAEAVRYVRAADTNWLARANEWTAYAKKKKSYADQRCYLRDPPPPLVATFLALPKPLPLVVDAMRIINGDCKLAFEKPSAAPMYPDTREVVLHDGVNVAEFAITNPEHLGDDDVESWPSSCDSADSGTDDEMSSNDDTDSEDSEPSAKRRRWY